MLFIAHIYVGLPVCHRSQKKKKNTYNNLNNIVNNQITHQE